jgi:glycyl-tRNA synthetase
LSSLSGFGSIKSDAAIQVLSFPPAIAPTKVLLVPLSANPDFKPLVANLTKVLRLQGLSTRVDDSSASIGKR